jgi:DNA-binding transcriptional ArsR family regulator
MALAKPFEMTQPAISQHWKVLEDAGLIVRRVEGDTEYELPDGWSANFSLSAL